MATFFQKLIVPIDNTLMNAIFDINNYREPCLRRARSREDIQARSKLVWAAAMAENGILKIGFAEMNISADADDKAVADTTVLI